MSQIKVTQFPSSWEEGCPKGGVVGDQERPMNHIPKEFFSYLPPPPPPFGVLLLPGGGELSYCCY